MDAWRFLETLMLDLARGNDAFADAGGGLFVTRRTELVERNRHHLHVHVDAVKQGAADAGEIALHLDGGAQAFFHRVR
jgi:hypothetical protein